MADPQNAYLDQVAVWKIPYYGSAAETYIDGSHSNTDPLKWVGANVYWWQSNQTEYGGPGTYVATISDQNGNIVYSAPASMPRALDV